MEKFETESTYCRTRYVNYREWKNEKGEYVNPSDNEAARTWFHPDGNKYREIYYKNNEKHKDDGPAEIVYNSDCKVLWESYYKNGIQHHDGDVPSTVSYYTDGKLAEEQYYHHGVLYRPNNKPCWIEYKRNGSRKEVYNCVIEYNYDEYDNLTDYDRVPAVRCLNDLGKTLFKQHFNHGREVKEEDEKEDKKLELEDKKEEE